MKINTNMSAFITNKQLLRTENKLTESMERLSSGLKLNHAKDNPAGMAISNKMRAQIAGLDRASDNASDGISAIQIADGALNETISILQRMRELSVQAANDTNGLEDKEAIQQEIDALKEEVNRISTDTEYNQMPLLNGYLCNRVYSNNVSRVYTSDEVTPGDYQLTVEKAATQAALAGDSACGIDVDDNTTEAGIAGTITINGSSAEILETDTPADIYQKIRDAAEIGEADASLTEDGMLAFHSTAFGANARLAITFSDENFASALGFNDNLVELVDEESEEEEKSSVFVYGTVDAEGNIESIKGEDVQITLSRNTEESAFSDTATVLAAGNKITITDKGGFTISFLLDEGYEQSAGYDADLPDSETNVSGVINLEVTDIGTMVLQIGANMDQNMEISIPEVSSSSLYIDDLDVTTVTGADRAIVALDAAISQVSAVRSKIGAYENRLDYAVASLDTFEENMTDALSRLSDTDMAEEMTTYTQQNILDQAAISVLTQANDLPQQVLQLLQ